MPLAARELNAVILSAITLLHEAQRRAKTSSVEPDLIGELAALITLSLAFRDAVVSTYQRKARSKDHALDVARPKRRLPDTTPPPPREPTREQLPIEGQCER